MKKLLRYPVLLLFFVILAVFTVTDLLYPDREYSELENTTLQQRPAFNLSRLVNNQWTADYGDYVKEQFMFRDAWIDLQSRSESLFLQKVEIGGQVVGQANLQTALYTKQFSLKESEVSQLEKNTQYVSRFLEKYPNAIFMLAPSASLIYADQLPAGTPALLHGSLLCRIPVQMDRQLLQTGGQKLCAIIGGEMNRNRQSSHNKRDVPFAAHPRAPLYSGNNSAGFRQRAITRKAIPRSLATGAAVTSLFCFFMPDCRPARKSAKMQRIL